MNEIDPKTIEPVGTYVIHRMAKTSDYNGPLIKGHQAIEMNKIDVRSVFRRLVSNQFTCIEDFGYFGQRFFFRTAFSKTTYSYCCCSCAFEHEYLTYVSDTGQINEFVYEKIVKSIIDGQCPHVVKVSREHLRETSVYGIHVAASVAVEKIVKYHSKNYQTMKTGIFQLNPHALAVMKNKAQHEDSYYLHFPKLDGLLWISEPILYARSSHKNTCIRIEELDCLEMCVKKRNAQLLKSILHPLVVHMDIPKAFGFTIKHNLKELQKALLEYTVASKVTYKFYFAECSIMYNKPEILDKILTYRPGEPFEPSADSKLSELCTLFMREKCKRVLSLHGLLRHIHLTFDRKTFELIHRLDSYYDDFKIEIKVALTILLRIYPVDLSYYLYTCFTIQPVKINVVKILLSLGADVNYTDEYKNTPMIRLLLNMSHISPSQDMGSARKALELLIYENPNLELHDCAVHLGLQEDARLQLLKHKKEMDVVGIYRPDAKEHGLFGHDDPSDFALNFIGPFLIECGFPVTRSMLLEALDKPLHPAEHAFIKDYLDYPRPLKTYCRNVLRKHFRGRNLHNFMLNIDCHQKLKDFVLLDSVCLTI